MRIIPGFKSKNTLNDSQLAQMKKSIRDMSLPLNF